MEIFLQIKKPVQHLLKRVSPALAEFITRPQAEYQIGAQLGKLHLVMSFVKYPSI
jgi:hypothetical protein